jgi:hypothetical protein
LTSGSVLFSNGTTIAQDNANLFWDDTNNRLGVGTASPNSRINALDGTVSELKFNSGTAALTPSLAVGNTGGSGKFAALVAGTTGSAFIYDSVGVFDIATEPKSSYTANTLGGGGLTSRLRITAGGNVAIGTTTDAGFKLDVNGTTRTSGTALFQHSGFGSAIQINNQSGSAFSLAIYSNAAADTIFQTQGNFNGNNFRITAAGFAMGRGGLPTLDASALLNVNSTTQGFLPPRMTNTQKLAIASPAAGLVVYDTTLGKLCVRTASSWETITSI